MDKDKKENSEHNLLKAYNMLLYFAGTMAMFDPSNECIYDFWTKGIIKSLPVSSRNPRFIKAASQLRESISEKQSRYEMMKIDYSALFNESSSSLAPPFESAYSKSRHMMYRKQIPDVKEFYSSYGWVSKFKGHIPDDHIGIELLFLTLMIEKYLEFDDDACNKEMQNEIRRFIDQHIFSWVPEWNNRIQENAKTLSYKGIGTLIQACAEDIYSIMNNNIYSENIYVSGASKF